MFYRLCWSGYVQWTKRFDSDEEAVRSALEYINTVGQGRRSEFSLLRLHPVPLER